MLFLAAIPKTVTKPIREPRERTPPLNTAIKIPPIKANGRPRTINDANRMEPKSDCKIGL